MEHQRLKNIQQLRNLLEQEKNTDLAQYEQRVQSASFDARRKSGVCWYPVFLERTKFNSGDRLLVRVSRNETHTEPHLFQSGKLIKLFSNAGENDENECQVTATINQVSDYDMLVTLHASFLPEWIHDGRLGVQLLFDDHSYKEMEFVLKRMKSTEDPKIHRLMDVIWGIEESKYTSHPRISIPALNDSQEMAVQGILSAQDVSIVHGPPGTGKTTTLVQAILESLKRENQVLVCTPSNAAADHLTLKIFEQGISVLRIGHPARITNEILENTLDYKTSTHASYKLMKDLRAKSAQYRSMAHKYKRNFGKTERDQRRLMFDEAHKLKDEAESIARFIHEDIILKTRVIVTTLVGANAHMIRDLKYHTVFIDEAAQALEPACWIPILKGQKVVLAGDHKQLPPTVKTTYEKGLLGLKQTLFEKAISTSIKSHLLNIQYRMHEDIMKFSSKMFYEGSLKADATVADRRVFNNDDSIQFIDTAGCGYHEQLDKATLSAYNLEEIDLLFKHLKTYLERLKDEVKLDELRSIAIISPYKAQVERLKKKYEQIKETLPVDKIHVNTIDSFQGQERDVVYISLVRSNDEGKYGFLSDTRRMNVAMTRAQRKLVVVGDSATVGQHTFYAEMVDYIDGIGGYQSAFELI